MVYTARTLITRAYYLSQVISRDLQTVSADQIEDGLFLLNSILDFKSSDIRLIPYYQEIIFNTVQRQEMYYIPNLLSVDSMTFNIGPVRYAMEETTRVQYFGQYRVDNIETLPYLYRMERALGGMNVYMYFIPSQVFVMKIWGKFSLPEVALDTDMSTQYDYYFIEFLRYALAQYICSDYGSTFPDECKAKYHELQKKLMEVSPPDLSVRGVNWFGSGPGLDWQLINLSNGYIPF